MRSRRPHRFTVNTVLGLSLLFALVPSGSFAQVVVPPFDDDYTLVDLGSVPDLPPLYGGLNFKLGDPDTLIIGGFANSSDGMLYEIGLIRDAGNHIIGFDGAATVFAEAPFIDGGLAYGPDDVLFLSRYPVNEIGQLEPGSGVTDKVVDLDPLGVTPSPGAVQFVPPGFPGAGSMKIISWPGGQWYDLAFAPDGDGTFDILSADLRTTVGGGPEGLIYVPLGSPEFANPSTVVGEFSAGNVAAYEIDADGDAVVATRRDFITGLSGAEGAVLDPLTNDFLFSTFGGGNRVLVVQGFEEPGVANDLCDNKIAVDCDTITSGTTIGANDEGAEDCDGSGEEVDVWYSIVGDGSNITASFCAGEGGSADYDTVLDIYTGTCDGLTCFASNDDGDGQTCGLESEVTWTSIDGERYEIRVSGFDGDSGDFELAINCVQECDGIELDGPAKVTGDEKFDLEISCANPDARILVSAGRATGGSARFVPGCGVVAFDIGPRPNNFGTTTADGDGNAVSSQTLGANFLNQTIYYQVLDSSKCEVSNVVAVDVIKVGGGCGEPYACVPDELPFCDPEETCVCVETAQGDETACVDAGATCDRPCVGHVDCDPGEVCMVNTCCGEPVCAALGCSDAGPGELGGAFTP